MEEYVEKLKLQNFKKFVDNEFLFEPGINVLVGDNDAGKSSVLKAIDIVLNQSGTDDRRSKLAYGTLMNKDVISDFLKGAQDVGSLPGMQIEVWLALDDVLASSKFDGVQNSENEEKLGVKFSFEFDETYIDEFEYLKEAEEGNLTFVPFELYKAKWTTFAGQSYTSRINPLKSIFIDTDKTTGDSFSNYTSQLFAAMNRTNQHEIGVKLKSALEKVHENIQDNTGRLGIDINRIRPIDFLEAFSYNGENVIPLRDMGSGTENAIKTELALKTEAKLILVEEPENHLSFTLARRQIENLRKAEDEQRQVIVTTHSPLIVNRMSLSTVRWLKQNQKLQSFSGLNADLINYFERMDNVDLLQVLLSSKLIIVEGPTEYILMENMIKSVTSDSAENQGIHIMSMQGDHYKRFVELAKEIDNKVLIVTDNDSNLEKIKATTYDGGNVKVVLPENVDEFTFEVSLYEQNKAFIEENESFRSSTKQEWHSHKNLPPKLVFMLNNKVDSAIGPTTKYIESDELQVPKYILEGIKWLVE